VLNEFRQDLVSGEWVLFATERGKNLTSKSRFEFYQPKEDCPFEETKIGEQEVVWAEPSGKDWWAAVIKNKYPAVRPGPFKPEYEYGPFKIQLAVGDHEVIVFRDHDKGFDEFSREELVKAIQVYKRRYKELSAQEYGGYSVIFHNHGREAGASIYHTHSQIISTPILPPDISRSLYGSFRYYRKYGKRVYDVLLDWESKQKKRIVYENDDFVAFSPFVSKYPYEIRIFPKESHAHFDKMPDAKDPSFADAFYVSLQKMKIALKKPSFNFFIHTAPSAENKAFREEFGVNLHDFYHWHMEIIPHLKIDAGFEIGTGIEINVVDPDESAEILRNVKI